MELGGFILQLITTVSVASGLKVKLFYWLHHRRMNVQLRRRLYYRGLLRIRLSIGTSTASFNCGTPGALDQY